MNIEKIRNVLLLSAFTVATITSVSAADQQSILDNTIDYTSRETVMNTVDRKSEAMFFALCAELSNDQKIGKKTAAAAHALNNSLRPDTNPAQEKESLLQAIMADTYIPNDKKEHVASLIEEVGGLYFTLMQDLV